MLGGSKRISIGNSRRRNPVSKKQIIMLIVLAVIIFLSIWQMPIKQKTVSENIDTPVPTEIK